MRIIFFSAALIVYVTFLARISWHVLGWLRGPFNQSSGQGAIEKDYSYACIPTLLDLVFFRRIFTSDKIIWAASWTFHVSFFFVMIRHLRYFFPSLPGCLVFFQPAGVFFGYLLPISLLFLMAIRVLRKKDRYVSSYNYMISGMLLLIGATGVLMRSYFRLDLISVKQFSLGISSLRPAPVPESAAFLFHFIIFLALISYLPVHFIAAPFVNLEANRRKEKLRGIMHD